ncbi:MAG TPA: 50S ribosomal protein L29 [Phycisphaerales bacterium]|nr:50S ribosomal protein L29 [Phycisphaerales bacterium]HCD30941.1 50S ribosomal protein L29 [Phycisphaerales bacterium]|tara:strand:- start:2471 stop:2674 length:204 start_codon:yes stop_codon:yes gene_type:complete
MKASEIKKLSDDQIAAEIKTTRRQIFDLRSQAVTEKLENPGQKSVLRRDVARLLTEKRQRDIAAKGA